VPESLLLPDIQLDQWVKLAEFDDGSQAGIVLVPFGTDYTIRLKFIDSQVLAGAFDVEQWLHGMRARMGSASYGAKVDATLGTIVDGDFAVRFRFSGDPFVSAFVEDYRIYFTDAGVYMLTIHVSDEDELAKTAPDGDSLVLRVGMAGADDLAMLRDADMADSSHRTEFEQASGLIQRLAATTQAAATVSAREQQRTATLRGLAQTLASAERLLADPEQWLNSRLSFVAEGLDWATESSALEQRSERLEVLRLIRSVARTTIDGTYFIRTANRNNAWLDAVYESLCELALKIDTCTSLLTGDPVIGDVVARTQVLLDHAHDPAQITRLRVLSAAAKFMELVLQSGMEREPDELWKSIADNERGLDLMRAINDIGGLLVGVGRLANDLVWQAATFVLDATFVVPHTTPLSPDDKEAFNEQVERTYELQRAAGCHAHGISVDEYAAAVKALDRKTAGSPPHHTAIFLRNVRSSRRYMMPNKFVATATLRDWLIEPPRVSLEGALGRAVPQDVNTVAMGGGWDCFGLGRIAALGHDPEREPLWMKLLEQYLAEAQFVLMLPSASEGVRHEMAALVAGKLLLHVVCIMPPADAVPSGEHEWKAARGALATLGVALPEYDPAGAFVLLDANGELRHKEPFATIWNGGFADMILKYVWRGLPPVGDAAGVT